LPRAFHFVDGRPGGWADSPPVTVADLDAHASAIAVRLAQAGGMRLLVADLGSPRDVLSWAIVNGGQRIAATVVWREVRVAELGSTVEAATLMRDTLASVSAPAAVGLLTARDVRRYERERVVRDGVDAECLATVGLGNFLAAGDPTTALSTPVGTINLLCRISVGLTEEALVEACAVAVEARTAAVLTARLPSPVTGRPATGTGTDCIVVAAPVEGRREQFAGKHTACGSAIGAATFGAVSRGVARWLEENR
jgi:adenosylcobinamide amidohydrolase